MENLIATVVSIAPLILMFAVLYFFMIRPQKKKEQAVVEMRNALEVGDYVTTIGGVMGRIIAVRDDQVTIETGADRVKLHFAKWAVQTKSEAASE